MPMPRKEDPIRNCQHCGQLMQRKIYNGRLEDRAVLLRRKYCNQACMAMAFIHQEPSQYTLYTRLRKKLQKSHCEICGSSMNLCNHHRDGNWKNNDPSNFRTLCNSCHTKLHHQQGDLLQKKEKPPCYVCGRQSYRLGLCNTCRTRQRRNGNPYLVRRWNGSSWQVCVAPSGRSGLLSLESPQECQTVSPDCEHSETQ